MQQLASKVRQTLSGGRFPVALLFFLVTLFLVFPLLQPSFTDINPFDESVYINSGRMLLDKGVWEPYAGNPLVSIFYALTYLPFRSSPYWLVLSCSLGRVILFTLIWWSAYLVAGQFSRWASPLITAGFLLVNPLPVDMLSFPSDPLFAGLAGLSFWQLVRFYHHRQRRSLWLASLFLGLAAMARNDGLVIFALLLLLTLFLSLPGRPWKESLRSTALWKNLAAAALPFALIVGGYVVAYGLATGSYELGTARRAYDNFEAGQQAVYAGTGEVNAVTEAKLEARRLFGTPEENRHSILAAIRRNPPAYLQRLEVVVRALPSWVLHAYGIRFAAVLFLLALAGAYRLARQRQYGLLALVFLWPAHLVTGFAITIFREGHLLVPFYLVFALGAVGLAFLVQSLDGRRGRLFWTFALLAVAALGLAGGKAAVYYNAAVFLAAVWVIILVKDRFQDTAGLQAGALLVLLCAGLVLRGGFPSPSARLLGASDREQGSLYLAQNFPPDSKVAAGSPGPVWMAKMTYTNLVATDLPRDLTSGQFLEWMRSRQVRAVYVDQTLYNSNPALWNLIESQIGKGLDRVFSAEEGDVQVLRMMGN